MNLVEINILQTGSSKSKNYIKNTQLNFKKALDLYSQLKKQNKQKTKTKIKYVHI